MFPYVAHGTDAHWPACGIYNISDDNDDSDDKSYKPLSALHFFVITGVITAFSSDDKILNPPP